MPGPKPTKKPKAKPIKHANGVFSFIDCEDTLQSGIPIFKWSTDIEDYVIEDEGTYLLDNEQTIDVDANGEISNIY